jgi:hypothetical protein
LAAGDSSGLGQRRGVVVGELEGAEAGHHIEVVVGPGQRLEVADADIRIRGAFGRDLGQFG